MNVESLLELQGQADCLTRTREGKSVVCWLHDRLYEDLLNNSGGFMPGIARPLYRCGECISLFAIILSHWENES